VSDHTIYSRKLSAGELDQIERHAITLEKATRPKGCKNGVLGQCALDVLRTLRRLTVSFQRMEIAHPSHGSPVRFKKERRPVGPRIANQGRCAIRVHFLYP